MSDIEIQNLTKSCNEILILASLSRGLKHGYQLALEIEEKSEGHFKFNHGTLYPILHKLEKEGLIKGSWESGTAKRKRKCYSLTAKGKTYKKKMTMSWSVFNDRLQSIMGGDES